MLGPRLAPGKGGLHASSLQQAKAELSALTGSLGRPFLWVWTPAQAFVALRRWLCDAWSGESRQMSLIQ